MVADSNFLYLAFIQSFHCPDGNCHWPVYLRFLLMNLSLLISHPLKGSQQAMLVIDEHPLLETAVVITEFDQPIGETPSPIALAEKLAFPQTVPIATEPDVKPHVRDMLRFGGYKPTGRGKPASEYLRQAVEKNKLSPINLPVDICNIVSLHSGLPISVIDVDLASEPLRIRIAPEDSHYVFNQTGQTIKLDGLLCLFDNLGACANAVKDSQRTKTSPQTRRTLSIIWGTQSLPKYCATVAQWYCDVLNEFGTTQFVCPTNKEV